MERYTRKSSWNHKDFFSVKGSKQYKKEELRLKIEPIQKNFYSWLEHHKNFPEKLQKYILKDILHYSEEELKKLSLIEYNLALNYALETYVRRDVFFIMKTIFTKEEKSQSRDIGFVIPHPEIEAYIKEQYKEKE